MGFIIIQGKAKKSQGKTRKFNFPTINIKVSQSIKKVSWGMYFSLVKVGDKSYPGVTYLGPPKTFRLARATCETYPLTLRKDLANKIIKKILIFKFRNVEESSTIARFKKQIKKDIKAAKKFFGI